jgi:branched-chain amino acid transport system ATP-binding protein
MILRIENLNKSFGGLHAVCGVSFGVKEGELVGIIGPNGAGKTTLFALISGHEKNDSGDIIFKGKSLKGLGPHKRCVMGLVRTFQITQPFRDLTVLENVMVGSFARTNDSKKAGEEALAVLSRLEMEDLKEEYAKNLNPPALKRLEIARALATKPELLMLDEVFAGLTPGEIKHMCEIIKYINKSGVTILMIEHVMGAVMLLSERIIVMHYGKNLAEGTVDEIVSNEVVQKAYFG